MASTSLVLTPSTAGHGFGAASSDDTANNEDLVKNIDVLNIDNKIHFFRFMGLEIKKVSDTETDKSCNNGKRGKFDRLPRNAKRSCKLPSDAIHCDTLPDSSKMRSTANRQTNKRTNQSDNMIDSHKSNTRIRGCSVVIIGEKCRKCGRDFKCIKDVESHMKKRHKSKKPNNKKHVVLKIGDEVMARVPIRRKHLKRAYREIDRGSNHNDVPTLTSCVNEINRNDRINQERLLTPLINVEDICDIADTASRLSIIAKPDVLLSSLRYRITGSSNHFEADDEEIKEVLRIRRAPKFGASINHETPNRTERELLLSDAIREFDRIDNDPMDIFEFTESEAPSRDLRDDFMEDYCWFADGNLRNDHLDLIENNCSYHINDDYDIDAASGDLSGFMEKLNPKYSNDENTYAKEYRRENGDVIPDYIDYTECLDDNYSGVINNNKSSSDVCNIESSFYNEAQIREWNRLTKVSDTLNCNVPQRTKAAIDLPIFIKEEIILDDTR